MQDPSNQPEKFLLEGLKKSVQKREVLFIAGAGVSMNANPNAPSWLGLIRHGADRVMQLSDKSQVWRDRIEQNLQSNDMIELLAAAQKVCQELGGPSGGEFKSWFRDVVGSLKVVDPSLLTALSATGCLIATTNYDSLLSEITGRPAVPWTDASRFQRVLRSEESGILHIHGHWQTTDSIVFGSSDYERIRTEVPIQELLRATLILKTVVFVGFGAGLGDPNFGQLIKLFDMVWGTSETRHYKLVKESELEEAKRQRHETSSRISPISYGSEYGDLAPFIQSLAEQDEEQISYGNVSTNLSEPAKLQTETYSILLPELEKLKSQLSESLMREFETMKSAWLSGQRSEANEWVRKMRSSSEWEALSPPLKAQILRFGVNVFALRSPEEAKVWLEESLEIESTPVRDYLEALICLGEGRLQDALRQLEEASDDSSLKLRANLFLEMGRIEEAERSLKCLKEDAEFHRLHAILNLLKKDRQLALESVAKAEELAPRAEAAQYTGGIVRFYSAHSVDTFPPSSSWFLTPIPPGQVLATEESRALLRKAKSQFESLQAQLEQGLWRQECDAWLYAIHLELPEITSDADKLAQTALDRDPRNWHLVRWCLARGQNIDLQKALEALGEAEAAGSADLNELITLSLIYTERHDFENALGVLDRAKGKFESSHRLLWISRYVMNLLAQGKANEARELLTREDPDFDLGLELYFQLMKLEGASFVRIAEFAEERFKDKGAPEALSEAAYWRHQAEDWPWLLENEEVLRGSGNSQALLNLAEASFRSGDWQKTLELLKDLDLITPLSAEIEIRSYLNLGLHSEAEKRLTEFSKNLPNPAVLGLKLFLGLSQRDIPRIRSAAASLLEAREAVAPGLALDTARALQSTDADLAKALLRTVLEQGVKNDRVSQVLSLSFQLGLEDDPNFPALMKKAAVLAEQGESGFSMEGIDRFHELQEAMKEQSRRLQDAYLDGAPGHVILRQSRQPFALPYHDYLGQHEKLPYPSLRGPLLIRHGRRDEVAEIPVGSRLHMDVTAILLAHHFGILNQIEELFRPLGISSFLQTHLSEMIVRLSPSQPRQLEAVREALTKIHSGLITRLETVHLADELPDKATCGEAIRHFARKRDAFLLSVDPVDGVRTLDTLDLADHLFRQGCISKSSLAAVKEAVRLDGRRATSFETPKQGDELLLHWYDLLEIQRLDILAETQRFFKLVIPDREVNRGMEEWQQAEQRQKTVEWLKDLQRRISEGIRHEIYQQIPALPTYEWKDIELVGLEESLKSSFDPNVFLWIDDRNLSRSTQTERGNQIIGILDILAALHHQERLSEPEYFELLNRMRASNLMFIPVTAEEILYFLREAPVYEGALRETKELRHLRQNLAASLDLASRLEKPEGEQLREWNYLTNHGRAVEQALAVCFQREDTLAECYARANWVLENLWVSMQGYRRLAEALTGSDGALRHFSIAALFIRGYNKIPGADHKSRLERRTFFHWVWQSQVLPFLPNEELLTTIAQHIKFHLFDILESSSSEEGTPDTVKGFIGIYCQDLPEELFFRLRRDSDVVERVGPLIEGYTTLGTAKFRTRELLQGLDTILSVHASVEISSVDDTVYTIQCDGGAAWLVASDRKQEIPSSLVGLSRGDNDGLTEFIKDFFDCFDSSVDQARGELVSLSDSFSRFEHTQVLGRTSPMRQYARIAEVLLTDSILGSDLLDPPSPDRLLKRYRLDEMSPESSFSVRLSQAAESMAEESFQTLFDRLSCFPTSLPNSVCERFSELSTEVQLGFFQDNLTDETTPFQLFHLAHLVFQNENLLDHRDQVLEAVQRMLLSLDGEPLANALVQAARWSATRLFANPAIRQDSSTCLALAWAHAEELLRVFLKSGMAVAGILELFSQLANEGTETVQECFSRPAGHADVADPSFVSSIQVLLSSVSYLKEAWPTPLPERIVASLRSLVYPDQDSQMIHFGTFPQKSVENRLDSWFVGLNEENPVAQGLAPENPSFLSEPSLLAFSNRLLKAVEEDPKHPNAWMYLSRLLTAGYYDDELIARVDQRLSSLEIPELLSSYEDNESRFQILLTLLEIAGFCRPEARERLIGSVLSLISSETRTLNVDDEALPFILLVGLARMFTTAPSVTSPSREELYAESLRLCIETVPGIGKILRLPLVLLVLQGTTELAKECWPVLNLARAR